MINFYTSDTKDTSIIAYGDTPITKRKFKITFRYDKYACWKKISGKYYEISSELNLDDAKSACIKSWTK